jgi:hypothetical protein
MTPWAPKLQETMERGVRSALNGPEMREMHGMKGVSATKEQEDMPDMLQKIEIPSDTRLPVPIKPLTHAMPCIKKTSSMIARGSAQARSPGTNKTSGVLEIPLGLAMYLAIAEWRAALMKRILIWIGSNLDWTPDTTNRASRRTLGTHLELEWLNMHNRTSPDPGIRAVTFADLGIPGVPAILMFDTQPALKWRVHLQPRIESTAKGTTVASPPPLASKTKTWEERPLSILDMVMSIRRGSDWRPTTPRGSTLVRQEDMLQEIRGSISVHNMVHGTTSLRIRRAHEHLRRDRLRRCYPISSASQIGQEHHRLQKSRPSISSRRVARQCTVKDHPFPRNEPCNIVKTPDRARISRL